MLDEPMRAQFRSLLVGCALAVVAVAGCVIVAFVKPQDTLGDAPIVMVRESGALYVRLGDTLHPVLNLASARLIAGTAAKPDVIKQAELRNAKRGALLGIPGAPDVLPEPLPAGDSAWAVCDDATGTTVIAGPPATHTGTQPLQDGRAVLARSRSDSATYLLYDGRRSRISAADPAVAKALHLDAVEPTEVSSAVLNAIPEAARIAPPVISGAGKRSSLGIPVGSVVRVDRAGDDELYVALEDGVQRVGQVAADIIRFSDSQGARDIVTFAADAISATRTVESLAVTTFPDNLTAVLHHAVVCAQWLPSSADAQGGYSTVLSGSVVPLPAGQAPMVLAQADGIGPNVDAVAVPPGRCLYVQSTHGYLVTDTGVRFGVLGAESAAALGFPSRGVPAPWPIVRLLAEGPELSRAAALVAHDGVAPDSGVAAPR